MGIAETFPVRRHEEMNVGRCIPCSVPLRSRGSRIPASRVGCSCLMLSGIWFRQVRAAPRVWVPLWRSWLLSGAPPTLVAGRSAKHAFFLNENSPTNRSRGSRDQSLEEGAGKASLWCLNTSKSLALPCGRSPGGQRSFTVNPSNTGKREIRREYDWQKATKSPINQQLKALGVPVRECIAIAGIASDNWVKLEQEAALPFLGAPCVGNGV